MQFLRSSLLLSTVVVWTCGLFGHSAVAPPPAFQTSTTDGIVDVLVTEHHGVPVEGLDARNTPTKNQVRSHQMLIAYLKTRKIARSWPSGWPLQFRNLSYNLITRWNDKNISLDTFYRRSLENEGN